MFRKQISYAHRFINAQQNIFYWYIAANAHSLESIAAAIDAPKHEFCKDVEIFAHIYCP